MHLSKLSSVILKEDNKHLRHVASTKSPKMREYNADRMFVTLKKKLLISSFTSLTSFFVFFFPLKVRRLPVGETSGSGEDENESKFSFQSELSDIRAEDWRNNMSRL